MMPAQRSDRLMFIFLRFEVLRYTLFMPVENRWWNSG